MIDQIARIFVAATSLTLAGNTYGETYLELPIVGQIGTDVTPEMVHDVLEHAVARGADHVVLRIDTGGGFVPPAEQISEILHEFSEEFTYHTVIDKCISAGIWMAFAGDTLHMTPDAIWGAAAVHDTLDDNSTRYNEKSSAIYAAQIAAQAQRRGYSPVLVRGMVVTGAEVWSWRDAHEQQRLTAYRPDPGTHSQLIQLDGHATLLTLTTPEAVRAGLARAFNGDVQDLGEALGFAEWRRVDGYGIARSVHARYRRNLDDFVAFNGNLRRDPNLLSWRDYRYDGLIPSLFGQPRPGLKIETAEQALTSFIDRLESAYATALAAEPEFAALDRSAKQRWSEQLTQAVEAWGQIDALVVEIEKRYEELTGIRAELNSLKAWPLQVLQPVW